jgi:transcriptional regulator GlxA family with amidase domain
LLAHGAVFGMASERNALAGIDRVAMVLYEGFDELDAIGPHEVLANAASDLGLTVSMRTLDATEEVKASHGLGVVPDGVLDEYDPDLLVVPGGGWNDRSKAGARAEVDRGDLPEAIAAHHDTGGLVASVCTGGMIVAVAGLFDDRPATTHHGAIDDLRERGIDGIDARVVDSGEVLSAGGVTSGIDLAFHIVERMGDVDLATRIAREMEYERSTDIHRAESA